MPAEIEIKMQCEKSLPNLEMLSNFSVLNTPKVWIEDTGTTVDNTPHLCSMTNIRKPAESDHSTVGKFQKMEPDAIGDVKGVVTNRNGRAQMKEVLNNVVHTPASKCNLLSLTKLMAEGWPLKGGKNRTQTTKDGNGIDFDVIIKTRRGKS